MADSTTSSHSSGFESPDSHSTEIAAPYPHPPGFPSTASAAAVVASSTPQKVSSTRAPHPMPSPITTKKRGRPPKRSPHPGTPDTAATASESKRRGRPPKLTAVISTNTKKKRGRPLKSPAPVDPASTDSSPQVEHDISPDETHSLIDSSAGKRKRGRPRNVDIKEKPDRSVEGSNRKPGRPRKNSVTLDNEQKRPEPASPAVRTRGRPRKIRDISMPEKDRDLGTPKKRGRPRKNDIV